MINVPKNQSRKKKEILKLNENKNTAKRLEHGEGSSARGIYSMKFHTLKKKSGRATNKCFNDTAQNVENKSKPNPNPADGKKE